MRHGDKIKNLSRTKAHRDALLANLSCQLIQHKRIVTTVAKAKALRVYVEPLITKSKDNTTHQRRIVFSYLQDKTAVTELFNTISAKVAGRPGGYTRIIKLGIRPGDAAEKAMIELVDFNEIYGKGIGEDKGAAKKTRRRGGSGKKKSEGESTTAKPTDTVKEAKTGTKAPVKATKDNLLKIEGIGPKSGKALKAAGINTFADLAKKSADELKTILTEADGEFNLLVPDTWPQQAALAADGKWEELAALQSELKGGKAYDDLAKVEGIGPKAAEALNAAGIHSFAQLAAKTPEEIKAVLDAAENLSHLVPDSWPKQAKLAAKGKWDDLDALQEELKAGR